MFPPPLFFCLCALKNSVLQQTTYETFFLSFVNVFHKFAPGSINQWYRMEAFTWKLKSLTAGDCETVKRSQQ